MRTLPIYFLVDVSESMVGEPIARIEEGMRDVIKELQTDPYALETVSVSVIAFAGKAEVLCPLQEIIRFYPPDFPIGGGTSLGAALTALMEAMDKEVRPATREAKGDWRPIVFLFTDGAPTDDYGQALTRWKEKYSKKCTLIAISVGDGADLEILSEIANEVLMFKDKGSGSYKQFFKWVTASIQSFSQSVVENIKQGQLVAGDSSVVEKIDLKKHKDRNDDNYAVLLGRCQNKKQDYLIKFIKRVNACEDLPCIDGKPMQVRDYRLVGAFAIDRDRYARMTDENAQLCKVHISDLSGSPSCPCCGNRFALIICGCGNIFCGEAGDCHCPWCGKDGVISPVGGDETITRRQG